MRTEADHILVARYEDRPGRVTGDLTGFGGCMVARNAETPIDGGFGLTGGGTLRLAMNYQGPILS